MSPRKQDVPPDAGEETRTRENSLDHGNQGTKTLPWAPESRSRKPRHEDLALGTEVFVWPYSVCPERPAEMPGRRFAFALDRDRRHSGAATLKRGEAARRKPVAGEHEFLVTPKKAEVVGLRASIDVMSWAGGAEAATGSGVYSSVSIIEAFCTCAVGSFGKGSEGVNNAVADSTTPISVENRSEGSGGIKALFRLAAGAVVFRSADGHFRARVPVNGRREILGLRTEACRDWLADAYLKEYRGAPARVGGAPGAQGTRKPAPDSARTLHRCMCESGVTGKPKSLLITWIWVMRSGGSSRSVPQDGRSSVGQTFTSNVHKGYCPYPGPAVMARSNCCGRS